MRMFRSISWVMLFCTLGLHLRSTRCTTPPMHSGVWVSTYGSVLLRAFPDYRACLQTHSRTAYVDVYTNGPTFASDVGRDPLGYLQNLEVLKKENYEVYAWFQDGLALDTLTPQTEALVFPEKIDRKYWLDITNPAARAYILNIFRDFRRAYPDTPVHLDDHWAVPHQFGDHEAALTKLTREVVALTGPVSLSAHPLNFSREKYNLDWGYWAEAGLLEEFILQNYVPANFALELTTLQHQTANWSIPVKIGVYGGPGFVARDVEVQIRAVQAADLPVVLFPWKAFYF